jgi:sporadic carbohydrate cluster protein (TIGR04323 family)
MSGYQGYVTSCAFKGARVAQHIQNIVIRDYCSKMGFKYLLSGTEYAIPGSCFILQALVDNLPSIQGIVAYSLFQMPLDSSIRQNYFLEIIRLGKEIHFAVEGISISCMEDLRRADDIWLISEIVGSQQNIQELI